MTHDADDKGHGADDKGSPDRPADEPTTSADDAGSDPYEIETDLGPDGPVEVGEDD